jgi:hypothetical protein
MLLLDGRVCWETFFVEPSRVVEQKKNFFLSFFFVNRVKRWRNRARRAERKAGSVAYFHRDDGMYHLKVINLKISRERRQERKKRKKFAYRSFDSNKSRALRSPVEEKTTSSERKQKRIQNWNELK